jgi:hypothetical protein
MKCFLTGLTLTCLLVSASGCSAQKPTPPGPSQTDFPTPLATLPFLLTPPFPATQVPPAAAPSPTALVPGILTSPTPLVSSTLQIAPAERISFDAGATSSDVSGSLLAGGQKWFAIGALKGQTMLLSLSSAGNAVYLAVTDGSGNALAGPGQHLTSWSGALPSSGDYLVEVFTAGGSVNYNLQVTIPQRIVFDQGVVSATVSGSVGKSRVNNYLVRAMAGQTMTVTLSSAALGAALTISGIQDGQPLLRSALGQTSWSGKLAASQDYSIDVVSSGDALDYSLKVTIK